MTESSIKCNSRRPRYGAVAAAACILILLALACFQGSATSVLAADFRADVGLFSDFIRTPTKQIGSAESPAVLRSRLVSIQWQLLPPADSRGTAEVQVPTKLTLNLFEDALFTAVLERLEAGFAGLAWIGRLDGIPGSEVTLVYNEDSLSGSVTFDNASFQIRPMDESLYVIREIDPSLFRTAAGCSGLVLTNEEEVFNLVNQERAVNSLHALNCDDRLVLAARNHSEDMAENNYFSHTSLDGRVFSQRITNAGYIWNSAGENIAAGYSTPQAVMTGWMNSSGHRANILDSTFCDLGVGYAYGASTTYGDYWTQDFGRQAGVSSCGDTVPPPPPPPEDPVVSGAISTATGTPIEGVLVTFSNNGGTATTDSSGLYSQTVPYNWSGTVTPSKDGYTFDPVELTFQNLTSDRSGQNFEALPLQSETIRLLMILSQLLLCE